MRVTEWCRYVACDMLAKLAKELVADGTIKLDQEEYRHEWNRWLGTAPRSKCAHAWALQTQARTYYCLV